ncbi:dienelactone hydrolase family protein [Phycicoccus endophyticus]|nr:dienelactone hydrolase family protein [Phycicoccus endophyticus]GGL45281.1 dienelactone hydrolase [Phycicoccus endophyticus]
MLLFHHVQGRTAGVLALADSLRAAGHTVHTPDLFDGQVFATIEEGAAFVDSVGVEELQARALACAEALGAPADPLVVAGISFGVMPALALAVSNPRVRGALLYEGFADPSYFGTWREGIALQVHGMADDPFFGAEGDLDAARTFVEGRPEAELFVYPGRVHLFLDSSLPQHDADAARLVLERSLALLARLG